MELELEPEPGRGRERPAAGGALPALLLLLLLPLLLPGARGGGRACPEGTYRAAPEPNGCLPCDVCDQGRSYLSRCEATANAVCRCPPGRGCGGNACQPCPEHCPPGTEPSPRAGCLSCPEGTFNARSSSRSPCRPFSRCPDDQILKPGTKESDVVCQSEPTRPPMPTTGVFPIKTTAPPETDGQMVPIAVSLAALLLCLLALFLSCLVFRSWAQEKSQEGGSACRGQPAQEVDDCSYCYPEEEEGGDGCNKASGAKWELLLEKVP